MFPKLVQQFTYWPIVLTLKIFFGYRIIGQENLKGLGDSSVIFASNHASYIDGPICAAAMPRGSIVPTDFFPIRFMAFKKFFNVKTNPFPFPLNLFTTAYVCWNGSIPVEKGTGELDIALAEPIRELKENKIKLWIYPEGGMTKDGKLQQGKRGVAYLHQKTGKPIVPVFIENNFKILNPSTWVQFIFRKKRLITKIGKPIYSLKKNSLEDGAENVMKEISSLA